MRRQTKILVTVIFGNFFLGLLLAYQRFSPYQETASNIQYFLVALLWTIFLVIAPSFILGIVSWFIAKRRQSTRVFHYMIFNMTGLIFLLIINVNETYKQWRHDRHRANIDYNKSLTKKGGYFDTCMTMVQKDIESQGISANDYRILSYSYDQTLTTLPKDTSDKFYSFEVIYSKIESDIKSKRAASYLISLNGKIEKVYDVDMNNKKAKEQIDLHKKDFEKINKFLKR